MPKGLHRPKPTCHPDRLHYGLGLCNPCYRKHKYLTDPSYKEKQKEKARIYRNLNKEKARKATRKYYLLNRDKRIAKAREYVKNNPEKTRNQRRKYYLEHREYILHNQRLDRVGLTKSDYDSMLIKQNGVCAICKKTNNGRQLIPDHCHKTLLVRGLLCHKCNVGIGLLNDSVETLESALLYLKQQKSTQGKVISAEFGLGSTCV